MVVGILLLFASNLYNYHATTLMYIVYVYLWKYFAPKEVDFC